MGLRFRKLENTCLAIQTCIILHNYAIKQRDRYIDPAEFLELDDSDVESDSDDENAPRPTNDNETLTSGKRFRNYIIRSNFTRDGEPIIPLR